MADYKPTDAEVTDVEKRFTYHKPKDNQPQRYEHVRTTAKFMAVQLLLTCPPSRERSLALTHLEDAVMWANAAIARNE